MVPHMGIIDELLTRPEFADRPPVLFDVGASGHVHAKWRPIARYCVCVAFDADRREMGYLSKTDGGFRTLHVCPAIVSLSRSRIARSSGCSGTASAIRFIIPSAAVGSGS